jgi:hypothetical protein
MMSNKITQRELRKFSKLGNEIKALVDQHKLLKATLIERLANGRTVEKGERVAILQEIERRVVAWKDVVVRIKSEGYANKVLAATKPTLHQKLIVR